MRDLYFKLFRIYHVKIGRYLLTYFVQIILPTIKLHLFTYIIQFTNYQNYGQNLCMDIGR